MWPPARVTRITICFTDTIEQFASAVQTNQTNPVKTTNRRNVNNLISQSDPEPNTSYGRQAHEFVFTSHLIGWEGGETNCKITNWFFLPTLLHWTFYNTTAFKWSIVEKSKIPKKYISNTTNITEQNNTELLLRLNFLTRVKPNSTFVFQTRLLPWSLSICTSLSIRIGLMWFQLH